MKNNSKDEIHSLEIKKQHFGTLLIELFSDKEILSSW